MAFSLPPEIEAKYAAARADEIQKRAMFAALNNSDLASSAKFWMQHCDAPNRFPTSGPIYDTTFWHIIVPEMIRRLSMTYKLKGGEEVVDGVLFGWTGNKCTRCKGHGQDNDNSSCGACAGTGDEWGMMPVQPPNLPIG